MTRILLLNYRDRCHPLAGGAEVHLHRIFGRLVELGHPVRLLTTTFAGAKPFEEVDGIQVERFGSDLGFSLLLPGRLRRAVQEFQPDLLIEDINKIPFYSFLFVRRPTLLLFHHLWGGSIFREAPFPVALPVWIHEQLMRFFYSSFPATAVSPSTMDELEALGFRRSRLSLVYNGAEEEWTQLEPPRQKGNYFLWLGRLRRYKGVWVAVHAMERLARLPGPAGARLLIAGSGPEEPSLRRYVERKGLQDRVEILGRVDNQRKQELLRGALALVQSSFKEGWGLTVIEAAACGTVSIASRVPGLRDSVQDGKTGILVPPGNPQALAQAMSDLAGNEDHRRLLEAEARTWARSFSWERAARETLSAIRGVLESSR